MKNDSYYADQIGDQIDWNNNMIQQFPNFAALLGFTPDESASILADCAMEVYILSNVTEMANSTYGLLHGFVKQMERGPMNSDPIDWPTLPVWPTKTMPAMVPPGIAARRSAYVATGKKSANYNKETIGRALRWEPTRTPFDPTTYVAQLKSVKCTGPEQVTVSVGKAGGQVTMMKLIRRLKGQTDFKQVGMFTARTYIDATPLAQPGVPETREYQLIAMKNDQVIGSPSPILTVTVSA